LPPIKIYTACINGAKTLSCVTKDQLGSIEKVYMRAFGPVPSRRLGQSLGINNIPPKVCTYSCIYCQIGVTQRLNCERRAFFDPDDLAREVTEKVTELRKRGTRIDYLSFVPDGEPTLDINLGEHIERLKPLKIKIAVITNSSLITLEDVRADLQKADLVSLKVDAASKGAWIKVNRPHRSLDLSAILQGMLEFRANFSGEVLTETMLLKGKNDTPEEIERIAHFLTSLRAQKSYIAVPTRPPAVKGVTPASDHILNLAYQTFKEALPHVEYLIGVGGTDFGFGGNVEEDLLSITSVHPMREHAVRDYLIKAGADWDVITDLIEKGSLTEVEYQGEKFYLRKFPGK
jgi:wyosine [tRNA(Phe)-imidazoG37] synthetase (radical SAM superfamily)